MEGGLLPVMEFEGAEFLVDIERREFRKADDADVRVWFYCKKGREMVRAMAGQEWRKHMVDNLAVRHCPQCGQVVGAEV